MESSGNHLIDPFHHRFHDPRSSSSERTRPNSLRMPSASVTLAPSRISIFPYPSAKEIRSMKRTLIISALVLVVAFPFLLASPPSSSITTDPEISAIVSNVDANHIFNTAQALQNFRTRQSCSDQPEPGHGVTPARDYLFAQYSAIPGLKVRLDPFVHANCPTAPTFN